MTVSKLSKEESDAAYRETLAQLGMSIGEDGRYRIHRPPPCTHKPSERDGAYQLTCDGCRRKEPSNG